MFLFYKYESISWASSRRASSSSRDFQKKDDCGESGKNQEESKGVHEKLQLHLPLACLIQVVAEALVAGVLSDEFVVYAKVHNIPGFAMKIVLELISARGSRYVSAVYLNVGLRYSPRVEAYAV